MRTFAFGDGDNTRTAGRSARASEHCKDNDLVVNVVREKKATNVRSSTKETFVKLPPPRAFNVEDALEYVGEDELVEVTAKSVRLRKLFLKETDRKRSERRGEVV